MTPRLRLAARWVLGAAPWCAAVLLVAAFLAPIRMGLTPSISGFNWLFWALFGVALAFCMLVYSTVVLAWFALIARVPAFETRPVLLASSLSAAVVVVFTLLQFPGVTTVASPSDFIETFLLGLCLALPRFIVRSLAPGSLLRQVVKVPAA